MMSALDESQYIFDFEGDGKTRTVQINDYALSHMMATLSGASKRAIEKYEQYLVDQGIPVFPVISKNDRESVEADFGAPMVGLSCYHQFIDANRAFRYEPVKDVESDYHTHFEQKMLIAKKMQSEGYMTLANWHDEEILASQIHFANGGVTRAFSDIARYLVQSFEEIEAIAERNGRDQRAAFIMPVPTYGLFLHRLEEITKATNVKIVKVRRHDNGAVDLKSLQTQLAECAEENRRVIGYYDCNPNNPTGYIRDKKDTIATAEILKGFSDLQFRRDANFIDDLAKRKSEGEISTLAMYYLDHFRGKMVIVDDMAYEGLELVKGKKPFSFGQVQGDIAAQAVILKGISKIGLPGIRMGMALAEPEFIGDLSKRQLMEEFSANSLGVDLLVARYGGHPKKHLLQKHQRQLRKYHQERYHFAKAMFRGIDNVPEMTEAQRRKMIKQYANHSGQSKEQAERKLQKGLPNFDIADKLESGFFVPIHMESLQGRQVAIKYDNRDWPQLLEIYNSQVLYWTLRAFSVRSVVAVQQGLSDKSLSARLTLSMQEKDFYRFFDKMTEMHDFFFGEKPEIQLDIFRRSQPKP